MDTSSMIVSFMSKKQRSGQTSKIPSLDAVPAPVTRPLQTPGPEEEGDPPRARMTAGGGIITATNNTVRGIEGPALLTREGGGDALLLRHHPHHLVTDLKHLRNRLI